MLASSCLLGFATGSRNNNLLQTNAKTADQFFDSYGRSADYCNVGVEADCVVICVLVSRLGCIIQDGCFPVRLLDRLGERASRFAHVFCCPRSPNKKLTIQHFYSRHRTDV